MFGLFLQMMRFCVHLQHVLEAFAAGCEVTGMRACFSKPYVIVFIWKTITLIFLGSTSVTDPTREVKISYFMFPQRDRAQVGVFWFAVFRKVCPL